MVATRSAMSSSAVANSTFVPSLLSRIESETSKTRTTSDGSWAVCAATRPTPPASMPKAMLATSATNAVDLRAIWSSTRRYPGRGVSPSEGRVVRRHAPARIAERPATPMACRRNTPQPSAGDADVARLQPHRTAPDHTRKANFLNIAGCPVEPRSTSCAYSCVPFQADRRRVAHRRRNPHRRGQRGRRPRADPNVADTRRCVSTRRAAFGGQA